jgi:hypothetical protein
VGGGYGILAASDDKEAALRQAEDNAAEARLQEKLTLEQKRQAEDNAQELPSGFGLRSFILLRQGIRATGKELKEDRGSGGWHALLPHRPRFCRSVPCAGDG